MNKDIKSPTTRVQACKTDAITGTDTIMPNGEPSIENTDLAGKLSGLGSLCELSMVYKRTQYPNVPVDSLVSTRYKDRTANELTKCIIDFLIFSGWQAERISNTGRMIDRRETYINVVGRSRSIGGVEWIKSSGTTGTADISATIAGKSVKIEVKIGKDRQSDAQRQYQASIESSGGFYVIAKTFQGFWEWYLKSFTNE